MVDSLPLSLSLFSILSLYSQMLWTESTYDGVPRKASPVCKVRSQHAKPPAVACLHARPSAVLPAYGILPPSVFRPSPFPLFAFLSLSLFLSSSSSTTNRHHHHHHHHRLLLHHLSPSLSFTSATRPQLLFSPPVSLSGSSFLRSLRSSSLHLHSSTAEGA